ncbi:MAG: NTP transferase domain-containing protein [Candidatus Micrarchaeota archaeon]|nr:NTP transferase domain-containing protein [Candidatus Micrarchaeota archaeon]
MGILKGAITADRPKYDCILICGGKGTRIRPITHDEIPKALVKVDGKELIQYSLDLLDPSMVGRLIFAVDHHEEQILRWVESLSLPYNVSFSHQERPGFLNAVECAFDKSDKGTVLLLHTDVIRVAMALREALEFHESSNMPGTVVTTYADRLYHHWVVSFDPEGKNVLGFTIRDQGYRRRPSDRHPVLTGTMILDREVLAYTDRDVSIDFAGLVQPLVDASKLGVYISQTQALFDVGTPEEFQEAEAYFKMLRRG